MWWRDFRRPSSTGALRWRIAPTSAAGEKGRMVDFSGLKVGLKGQASILVGEQQTAPRVGSGRVPVLATPVMINMMEAAALDAIEALLPAGHQSLGTQLNVGHYAATPVGMTLRATAEVTRVDGRTVEFRVEAFDDKERVGDGTHSRVVVNVERFDQRVQRKLNPS
jgi:fluoroacetyl-CoA thioesterase